MVTGRGVLGLLIAHAVAGCAVPAESGEPVVQAPLGATTVASSSESTTSASPTASAAAPMAIRFRTTRDVTSDPALAELLDKKDGLAKWTGLRELFERLTEPARTDLAIVLSMHETPLVRRFAVRRVMDQAPDRVRELAPLLEDTTPTERGCFSARTNFGEDLAVELAHLENETAQQFVVELAHRRSRIGVIALRESNLANTPAWRAIVEERLRDVALTDDLATVLLDAFVRAPFPDGCPLIPRWLASEWTRHRAVNALGRCEDPASLDVLLSLPSPDPSGVADRARAIALLSPALAAADRAKLLTKMSRGLRGALAEVLQARLRDASTAKQTLALVRIIVDALPEPEGESEPSFDGALRMATPSAEATELMRELVEKAPPHRYDVISGALGYLVTLRDAASLGRFRIALDSPDRHVVQEGLWGVQLLHDKPSRAKVERIARSTRVNRFVAEQARSTLNDL